jgi:hypothetical protein
MTNPESKAATVRNLITFVGIGESLDDAITAAEKECADTISEIKSNQGVSILNASSETLYINDKFYYIIKYFLEQGVDSTT